jgi:hypothetical protein
MTLAKKKTAKEERTIILAQPQKRPYGARVKMHVQHEGAIGGAEEVCISLPSGAFLSIAPTRIAPWEGGKKYEVLLEGFATAASAEAAGKRLVQALLWMAISTNAPMRLEYLSYEPAAVYERNRSASVSVFGYGQGGFRAEVALGVLQDAFADLPEPNDKLLLSMEVFCSARLEASRRAVFLSVVSALEPLAVQASLGDNVAEFVAACVRKLKLQAAISAEQQASLSGRLYNLRNESIRQALRRLANEVWPENPEVARIFDEAYALRSEIIHNGIPLDLDIDLENETAVVSKCIRSIYARMLQQPLVDPG